MDVFWGKVIGGKKRGKALGFPTANIALHKKIDEGIYTAKVRVNNTWHNALTFIGKAVTFKETAVQAESFLLDFSDNLYGKFITVKLLKKLRDNKKFNSAEELVEQMRLDEKMARNYFAEK